MLLSGALAKTGQLQASAGALGASMSVCSVAASRSSSGGIQAKTTVTSAAPAQEQVEFYITDQNLPTA